MEKLKKGEVRLWVISVGGYGSFVVKATEEGAEAMRKHKANWERGVGRKFLVPQELEQLVSLGDSAPSLEGARSYLAKKTGEDYRSDIYSEALVSSRIQVLNDDGTTVHKEDSD